MKKTAATFTICLALSSLTGCHANTATNEPNTPSQSSTSGNPDPGKQDCDAISDPGQAENCRFLKSVEEAKKKSHSDPVVNHNPGSIQQP